MTGGNQNLFTNPKGGPNLFYESEEGKQNFFTYAKGGPEKNGDRPSQTDATPLPVKNDSSLNEI